MPYKYCIWHKSVLGLLGKNHTVNQRHCFWALHCLHDRNSQIWQWRSSLPFINCCLLKNITKYACCDCYTVIDMQKFLRHYVLPKTLTLNTRQWSMKKLGYWLDKDVKEVSWFHAKSSKDHFQIIIISYSALPAKALWWQVLFAARLTEYLRELFWCLESSRDEYFCHLQSIFFFSDVTHISQLGIELNWSQLRWISSDFVTWNFKNYSASLGVLNNHQRYFMRSSVI